MNRYFHEGIFPDIWKLANVIPIFKKEDKSQPSNYRPVALLSCIGKLQEWIIFKNMYKFLIDNNLLYVGLELAIDPLHPPGGILYTIIF